MSKALDYIGNIAKLLDSLKKTQAEPIEAAANAVAEAQMSNHNVFLFGTGHSHMLAEELFYRAGGLVNIRPILEESLMLHSSASKSTQIERLSGYAEIIFDHYSLRENDVLFVISNSGRNGVCVDMAENAKARGLKLIALTNMRHTMSGASRHPSGKRLFEFADIILDNQGCIGDACIEIPEIGRNVAPTSTALGAIILNAIEARAVEIMTERGFIPEVFSSSNVDGGDEINNAFVEKYKGEIISL